jgi:hypothetical protein
MIDALFRINYDVFQKLNNESFFSLFLVITTEAQSEGI